MSPPESKESDVIEGLQVAGWSPSEIVPYQGFRVGLCCWHVRQSSLKIGK